MYSDYQQTLAAVKRRYGRCKTQDTMMDLFRKLDKAITEKTRTEFKVGNIRNIIQKYYVTKDFPTCKDFEDDCIVQTTKEEYSPMIATLIHFMMFKNSIDKNRWDSVQREYHHTMNGKPSYTTWHENRPELYKIMDDELKLNARSHRGINELEDENEEISAVQRQKQMRRQPQRQQLQRQRFQPTYNRRPTPQQTAAMKRNTNNDVKKRLQTLLCRHCSKWAGENRYHGGAKGSDPNSSCPYDKNGRLRPGKRFIGKIAGIEVNEVGVEDYRCNEVDDLEYFDPEDEVGEVEDEPDLLDRALDPYCS